MKEILVSEIFKSFQGEGPNIGKKSLFIRFFGCNLGCIYCDSKYSNTIEEANKMMVSVLKFKDIHEITNTISWWLEGNVDIKNIVFTGGEPLLYKDVIKSIVKEIDDSDQMKRTVDYYTFEIETNGTIFPSDIKQRGDVLRNKIQYNISPKLSNSFNTLLEISYLQKLKKSVAQFIGCVDHQNINLKFVVDIRSVYYLQNDIDEITLFLEDVANERKLDGDRWWNNTPIIYLMPMGIKEENIKDGIKILNNTNTSFPFIISPRLHVLVYGNRIGV